MGLPSSSFQVQSLWLLSQSKNGQITASENSLRLHSAYNPQREAQGAVSSPQVAQKSITVFYGFGLGYHLLEWAKIYPQKNLLVIEPDLNHFFAAMMTLDLTPVFKLKNLIFALSCPPDQILGLFESFSGNQQQLSINLADRGVSDAYYFDIPAFTAHAQAYFDTVKSLIKRNQRKNEINAATLKKFGKLWCRNSLRNLDQLALRPGISSLAKQSGNIPFLIIGAGPSLEKALPYIKELKERCLIVCVETSLRALLRQGVQPDFIILTDPQFWAYKHIAGLKAPESFLITELSTYPAVFRFKCRQILLCHSQFPLGAYFEKKLGLEDKLADLGSGGSVASSAWNFAYLAGAKKIYTIGLDFAFPGNQTHLKGSSAEETYHTISNRLSASDTFTARALFSANAIMSKDYQGNPVLTDSRMKMFAWWFESRLANCPDVETFTLSPQGLNTPGIKIADLQEILQGPLISEQKEEFLARAGLAGAGEGIAGCREELAGAGEGMACGEEGLATSGKNLHHHLNQLKKNFPDKEFLQTYPFLKEYL